MTHSSKNGLNKVSKTTKIHLLIVRGDLYSILKILYVQISSKNTQAYLHNFLIRTLAFLVMFLGNSIASMPLRIIL